MDPTGPQTELLSRLLSAADMRTRVTLANLANTNTPGYKRQTVEFETLLQDAMRKGSSSTAAIQPEVRVDLESPAGPDGNNVTLEAEMIAMRENRILYETYASMLENHFSLIETAITGGT